MSIINIGYFLYGFACILLGVYFIMLYFYKSPGKLSSIIIDIISVRPFFPKDKKRLFVASTFFFGIAIFSILASTDIIVGSDANLNELDKISKLLELFENPRFFINFVAGLILVIIILILYYRRKLSKDTN